MVCNNFHLIPPGYFHWKILWKSTKAKKIRKICKPSGLSLNPLFKNECPRVYHWIPLGFKFPLSLIFLRVNASHKGTVNVSDLPFKEVPIHKGTIIALSMQNWLVYSWCRLLLVKLARKQFCLMKSQIKVQRKYLTLQENLVGCVISILVINLKIKNILNMFSVIIYIVVFKFTSFKFVHLIKHKNAKQFAILKLSKRSRIKFIWWTVKLMISREK